MFVIAEISTTVIIHPQNFDKNISVICENELNKKLANKVIHNVGLCINFRELVEIEESYLKPSNGAAYTKVVFRFVVFRPEISSIIIGKIKSCASNGIYVTLGFFDDIFIPSNKLQYPSRFDEEEKSWIWEYSAPGEENKNLHELYMDEGETIKFRVVDEQFIEHEPQGLPESEESQKNLMPCYIIVGAINECGLGMESWWS